MFNLIIDNASVKDFAKVAQEALSKWSQSPEGKQASDAERKQAEAGCEAAHALVRAGHVGEAHVFANITGGDQLFAYPEGTGRIVSVRVDSRPRPAPVSVPVAQTVPVAVAVQGATTTSHSASGGVPGPSTIPTTTPYPNEPGFGAIGDLKGTTPTEGELIALRAQEHPGEAPKPATSMKTEAPASKPTAKSGPTKPSKASPVTPVATRAARRAGKK